MLHGKSLPLITMGSLQLSLAPKKPRFLVGEGIVLQIGHQVQADLDMETVELNRSRTVITVAGDSTTLRLTGADHAALHRIHPLTEIGRRFHAPAGSAWTSELDLFQYTRPLPVGHYRISLSYDSVPTNEVEFEVAAAELLSNSYRWFGESSARDNLASLWTALDGKTPRSFFQTASAKDPGAVLTATDLGLALPPNAAIAQLNDIASFHFERYLVWLDGARLGWMKASDTGRLSEPAWIEHGLGDEAALAAPPLQTRTGEFLAVVANRDTAVLCGMSSRSLACRAGLSSPAVAWHESGDPAASELFFLTPDRRNLCRMPLMGSADPSTVELPGEALTLALDQWQGRGKAFAAIRDESTLEVIAWDLADRAAAPRRLSTYDVIPGDLLDTAALPDAQDLAMLFSVSDAWSILSQRKQYRAPRRQQRANLVAARAGLFVIEHSPTLGFSAIRLGEAPATEAI